MSYIVLDLEWNQSNTGLEEERKDLPFEIIEIGAIKLDKDMAMMGEFSQLVKPVVYHEMHHITSKLIHMKINELESGKPFVEVCNAFLTWCGQDYTFCTWGPLDLMELQRNMKFYAMEQLSKGPIAFFDVQKLFSIAYEDGKNRRSLEYAVDFLGIEKDIPFHRAFSDAYYTAKVMATLKPEIFVHLSFDNYYPPTARKEEIKVEFPTYFKYISRKFEDKQEAFTDKEVISSKCYLCHKNLRKKIKWFTPNGRHYYCVAECNKHGYIKGKIRVRKSFDGMTYIVKTLKRITPEEMNQIYQRKKKVKSMKS